MRPQNVSSQLILAAQATLEDEATEAAEVQQLFEMWWPQRRGMAHVDAEAVSFPVGNHINNLGVPMLMRPTLRFPKAKLTAEQIERASRSGLGDALRGIFS